MEEGRCLPSEEREDPEVGVEDREGRGQGEDEDDDGEETGAAAGRREEVGGLQVNHGVCTSVPG